ncbi:MAG: 4-hydroxy-3-methylbut-2-enyl diphosphate reductase [Ilumatobacteraceae bacterium]
MAEPRAYVMTPLRVEASAARRGASTADVVRTGMGARRSRRAARAMLATIEPERPIAVVGVCGGLDPSLAPGDVIVASEVRSADGTINVALASATLVAAELAASGLPVRVGAIVSSERLESGAVRRAELLASGALAVDMESAWLVSGTDRPAVVIRVVLDAPGHELRSLRTVRNLPLVRRRLAAVMPVVELWARAVRPREVLLAGPRSFCAGVERAIQIVERALDKFSPPVYVRRQIVHNTHVVGALERRGAVFVQELDEVPRGSVAVLAAHGVSPEVRRQAEERELQVIDATCPLVAKVHSEARRFAARGFHIVLVGHADHEEIEGTVGEARDHTIIVESIDDVDRMQLEHVDRVAYLTQTTLAVDEVNDIVARLRERFPALVGPHNDDICYATQNRQEAVAAIAPGCDVVLVVGSYNSSNSKRLVEVAGRDGTSAHLVDACEHVRLEWLSQAGTIGITAGASAPESKVMELVEALRGLGPVRVEERTVHEENVSFRLPPEVRE